MADWIIDGMPEWDMWVCDPRRYSDYANQQYCVEKAIELYQNEYAIGFPHEERPAGRPSKATPLYDRLKNKGAHMGARGGWERAVFFEAEGEKIEFNLSYHRTKLNFEEAVRREVKLVREKVGVLDLGGFSKFRLTGDGATAWLDHMICGNLPKVGRMSLSYFLNRHGRIMTEVTITRLGENDYWLISAAAGEWHDEDWMNLHMPDDGSVKLDNITDSYGTLVLAGPNSRDVLQKITRTDLSNKAFPWLSTQEIEVGYTQVQAMRVNYVGELGWELHVRMEYLAGIYDALMKAGEEFGIGDFGLYAMDSLRLDKCYRGWKGDLTMDYSPLNASLDRFINMDKADFIGKEALVKEQADGIKERFVPIIIDDEFSADAPYASPVYDGDDYVGLVTSGGYSHTLDKSIVLAYVRTDLATEGQKLTVKILGENLTGTVGTEPLFDPENKRLRGIYE